VPAPSPPAGYSARPATRDDFGAIVSLAQASDVADWGAVDYTAEFLRSEWALPGLDLRTDTWLVERDGEAAGYAWLLARDEHRELDGWGVVHPKDRGRGLGSYLMDRVEARAAEHAAGVTDGAAVLRWGVIGPDLPAHQLLEARGFAQVRQMWHMEIRLDPDVARGDAPMPPPGVVIRGFDREHDAWAAHAVLDAAFATHFGWVSRSLEEWAAHRLDSEDFDPALWFVAIERTAGDATDDRPEGSGRVIGLISGMVTGDQGFIGTLGVHPSSQGRGIGTALLRTAFRAFARRGLLDVSLEVDSENETGAVAVYERAGMRPSRRFDTFQKMFPGPAHS
jgi:mycothiol synthase